MRVGAKHASPSVATAGACLLHPSCRPQRRFRSARHQAALERRAAQPVQPGWWSIPPWRCACGPTWAQARSRETARRLLEANGAQALLLAGVDHRSRRRRCSWRSSPPRRPARDPSARHGWRRAGRSRPGPHLVRRHTARSAPLPRQRQGQFLFPERLVKAPCETRARTLRRLKMRRLQLNARGSSTRCPSGLSRAPTTAVLHVLTPLSATPSPSPVPRTPNLGNAGAPLLTGPLGVHDTENTWCRGRVVPGSQVVHRLRASHPDYRRVEMLVPHRAVELRIPEAEDAAIRGYEPVAHAIRGRGHPDYRRVEAPATHRAVELR